MPRGIPRQPRAGKPVRELNEAVANYPKTAYQAAQKGMTDLTEELADTERPVVSVQASPMYKTGMTEAARELQKTGGIEVPVDDRVLKNAARARRAGRKDKTELSIEERKRLGIKANESIAWARGASWDKTVIGNRFKSIRSDMPEARIVIDPETKQPLEEGDLVCFAYPSFYDELRAEEIDTAAERAISGFDGEAFNADMADEILSSDGNDGGARGNYERIRRSRDASASFHENRAHINSRMAQINGWLGPSSKTQGDSVEEVIETMARRMGSKEAALGEMLRQQALARRQMMGGEFTEDRAQHERRMREAFQKSGGKSVTYSIPAKVGAGK